MRLRFEGGSRAHGNILRDGRCATPQDEVGGEQAGITGTDPRINSGEVMTSADIETIALLNRRAASFQGRIERVAKAVAQEVQAEHR